MESRWYWLCDSSASKENILYGEQMILARRLQCQQGEFTIWREGGTRSVTLVLARRIYYMERRWYQVGDSTASKENILYEKQDVLVRWLQCQHGEWSIWRVAGTDSATQGACQPSGTIKEVVLRFIDTIHNSIYLSLFSQMLYIVSIYIYSCCCIHVTGQLVQRARTGSKPF